MGEAIEILLSVEERAWHEAAPAGMTVESLVERAVHAALSHAAPHLRRSELSIVLASDERVHALNREWRGQDKPTNVLSFLGGDPDDYEDEDDDDDDEPGDDDEDNDGDEPPPLQLGDIILAWPTVAREAGDQGKGIDAHLSHLVVHGVLHLLGYDHEEEDEATEMERLETDILARLGIADPYADPDTDLGVPAQGAARR
jgi:probable rRNA maturation factor